MCWGLVVDWANHIITIDDCLFCILWWWSLSSEQTTLFKIGSILDKSYYTDGNMHRSMTLEDIKMDDTLISPLETPKALRRNQTTLQIIWQWIVGQEIV